MHFSFHGIFQRSHFATYHSCNIHRCRNWNNHNSWSSLTSPQFCMTICCSLPCILYTTGRTRVKSKVVFSWRCWSNAKRICIVWGRLIYCCIGWAWNPDLRIGAVHIERPIKLVIFRPYPCPEVSKTVIPPIPARRPCNRHGTFSLFPTTLLEVRQPKKNSPTTIQFPRHFSG